MEQGFASRHLTNGLDAVESEECISGKIAKDAVRAQFAIETATLVGCALHVRSYRSVSSKETVTTVTNYRDGLVRKAIVRDMRPPNLSFNYLRGARDRFQSGLVPDQQRRALRHHNLPLLEVGK